MKPGYIVDNMYFTYVNVPNFITVSNYLNANKIVNISSTVNLSQIKEDIGVWKIKHKKATTL